MGDIKCAKCGEPWETFGVMEAIHGRGGDWTKTEAERFLNGDGCPCCGFGTICTNCTGTGKEQETSPYANRCPVCQGYRRITVRRLIQVDPYQFPQESRTLGTWRYGYVPNVKDVPVSLQGKLRNKHKFECLEGIAEEAVTNCWVCHADASDCTVCKGTGKFAPQTEDGQMLFQAAREALGDDIDGLLSELEDWEDYL